jgi:DNA-binding winged helix-turn-helix (wHTH) protein
VDLAEQRLWRGDAAVPLRRKPFAILRYLLAHPQRLVTHDELVGHVWGGAVISDSALRSHLHELRQVLGDGVIETVIGRGYRFVAVIAADAGADADGGGERDVDTRTAAAFTTTRAGAIVVGRDAELGVLRAALDRARGGQRQLCVVTGEPGIGKTTLVDAFLAELDDDVVAARGQCVEQYGSPEAYLAVIELASRLCRSRHGDRVIAALAKLAPTFLLGVPHLVPDGQLDDVTARARAGVDGRIARELIEALEAIAAAAPLVVVLEDLQWSDLATIDLLNLIQQRRERARLLVIATARRAETQTPGHPVSRIVRPLIARGAATAVALDRIAAAELARLIDLRFPGHAFPAGFAEAVDHATGGTPLFVTALLDDLVHRAMLANRAGRWELAASLDELRAHRPDSVRQLIDIQLDRLGPDEQRVLECAAVVGLEHTPAPIAAALELPVEQIDEVCDGLVRRGQFLARAGAGESPDGTVTTRYAMTHGLVHEVCLGRSAPARRQRWHRRIGEALEAASGARAPELAHVLAGHFEAGHDVARAVHYYRLAGDHNARRFASPDAMRMYRRAHDLLARLPVTPERDRIELDVLGGLSQATIRSNRDATREPLAMFERMAELASGLGDVPRRCQALAALSFRHSILAEYHRANELSDELDAIARTETFPPPLVTFARIARLVGTVFRVELAQSLALLEPLTAAGAGSALGATDRRVVMLLYQSVARWLAGQPAGARADVDAAIALAHELGDPYALGAGLCNLSRTLAWVGGPAAEVRRAAEAVLAIPEAMVWHNQCRINAAWAETRQRPLDRAACEALLAEYRERAVRFPMGTTLIATTLIAVLRASGCDDLARGLADEALAFGRDRGEVVFVPEFVRVRGELIEAVDPAAATARYEEALAEARRLGARALELRAARSLARQARDTPRWPQAIAAVRGAVAGFAAGSESADLTAARELLAAADADAGAG